MVNAVPQPSYEQILTDVHEVEDQDRISFLQHQAETRALVRGFEEERSGFLDYCHEREIEIQQCRVEMEERFESEKQELITEIEEIKESLEAETRFRNYEFRTMKDSLEEEIRTRDREILYLKDDVRYLEHTGASLMKRYKFYLQR